MTASTKSTANCNQPMRRTGNEDFPSSSKHVNPKKSPQKMKQKVPKDDQSDEGALVYPIGEKALVVFFDLPGRQTYHLGLGSA